MAALRVPGGSTTLVSRNGSSAVPLPTTVPRTSVKLRLVWLTTAKYRLADLHGLEWSVAGDRAQPDIGRAQLAQPTRVRPWR